MSDFLSNIVSNSLNLTESIQPRLTSIFEPPSGLGEELQVEELQVEPPSGDPSSDDPSSGEQERREAYEEIAIDAQPQSREWRREVETADYGRAEGENSSQANLQNQTPAPITESRARNSPSISREATSPLSPLQIPAPEPARPMIHSQAFYAAGPQPHVGDEAIRPASGDPTLMDSRAGVERVVESHSPQQQRVDESTGSRDRLTEPIRQTVIMERRTVIEHASPILSPSISAGSSDPGEQVMEPTVERIIVERTLAGVEPVARATSQPETTIAPVKSEPAPSAVIVHPKIAPYAEPQTQGIPARASARPETTIQVTIGRIEVRATTAPSSQARKSGSATPHVMGLDSYLRRRGSGGGR